MEIDNGKYCDLGTHIPLNIRYRNAHNLDQFSFSTRKSPLTVYVVEPYDFTTR